MPHYIIRKSMVNLLFFDPKKYHYVSTYKILPKDTDYIRLTEFEELGKSRYELLKWIENQHLINFSLGEEKSSILNINKSKENVLEKMKKLNLDTKRNDLISHFILLLACSSK